MYAGCKVLIVFSPHVHACHTQVFQQSTPQLHWGCVVTDGQTHPRWGRRVDAWRRDVKSASVLIKLFGEGCGADMSFPGILYYLRYFPNPLQYFPDPPEILPILLTSLENNFPKYTGFHIILTLIEILKYSWNLKFSRIPKTILVLRVGQTMPCELIASYEFYLVF